MSKILFILLSFSIFFFAGIRFSLAGWNPTCSGTWNCLNSSGQVVYTGECSRFNGLTQPACISGENGSGNYCQPGITRSGSCTWDSGCRATGYEWGKNNQCYAMGAMYCGTFDGCCNEPVKSSFCSGSPADPNPPTGCKGDPNCPGNACVGNTCTDCAGVIRGGTKSCNAAQIRNTLGRLDSATCGLLAQGWGGDPDDILYNTNVHLYFDSTPSDANPAGFSAGAANLPGEKAICDRLTNSAATCAVCATDNSQPQCKHRFSYQIPQTINRWYGGSINLWDGTSHTVRAYVMNKNGTPGEHLEVENGGLTFTGSPVLPHPTKISPSGTPSCALTSARLDWDPVPGANMYWVALDDADNGTGNPTCGGPFDFCWSTTNDYQDVPVTSGKNYTWTVTARNACGVFSDYGGNWTTGMSFNSPVCPTPIPPPTLTPIPPSASPTPANLACDALCQSNSECASNYCFQFACRNISCETDNTCLCTSPSLTPTDGVTPTVTPTDGVTPTVTPTGAVTLTPTESVTPTPTGSPACICDTDFTCSPECSFDLQSGDRRIQYNTPIACKLHIQGNPLSNIALQWCNSPKRTLGDADGNGQIDLTDYHWYRRMVKVRRGIPADINADFNGDGEVGSLDAIIILKTLNKL